MTDTPRGKNGWPKLLRNAKGLTVRTMRPLKNGLITIPTGTIGKLEESSSWTALRFTAEPCVCCGVKPHISRVPWWDFEVVTS